MTVPETPEVLRLLGCSWRWALPHDLKFVVSSWMDSGQRQFILGPGCPWPGLTKSVLEARRTAEVERLKWDLGGHPILPNDINDSQHKLALSLLRRIYQVNQKLLIAGALSTSPTLVAYDHEVAEYPKGYVVAWGRRDYAYVRLRFRKRGIFRALRAALDG
jgi:hypothetical protein